MFIPVILIGGSGTRLWPLSRAAQPKQLLPVASERYSMLQETLLRLRGLVQASSPLVLCNHQHRFQVAEQLQEINVRPHSLMLEPLGRNTSAAIAVATLRLLEEDPEALMLALPSDHVIMDVPAFHAAIAQAQDMAQQGRIVLFGIVPDKPDTGFGYIQQGSAFTQGQGEGQGQGCYEIARFVEKPDQERAQEYLSSGDYLWNSGMFMARADVILRELEEHAPQVLAACREAMSAAYRDLDFLRLGREEFVRCPSASFDTAVLEKTRGALVIPVSMGWSDVGSWTALWELHAKDESGNVCQGDVLTHDTHNCLLSSSKHLVATVGVRDLIVVETDDAVLVAHKDSAQDVKKIVEALQKQGRSESEIHRRVYRPWGCYEGIDREQRFQVKRITVKPQAQLSLQKHFHRSEHWIVVSGTAEVVRGEETHLISENQSIYIPLGTLHRLRNPGHIPLHLIEVQSGAYLGEDDIVRFDDVYGRFDENEAQVKVHEGDILDATDSSLHLTPTTSRGIGA
jgi:mannose-1-phosphate guanylyltransferase/mannose-6-phosphate isomerase